MVLAAGHYKQTQRNYIVAAIMNIVLSVATVKLWGLIGVAIGTLAAMAYQTIWLAGYDSKNFIYWPLKKVCKQFLIDGVTFAGIVLISQMFHLREATYLQWLFVAAETGVMAIVVVICVNLVFYRDKVEKVRSKFYRKH